MRRQTLFLGLHQVACRALCHLRTRASVLECAAGEIEQLGSMLFHALDSTRAPSLAK
jgi:hypothetical protein